MSLEVRGSQRGKTMAKYALISLCTMTPSRANERQAAEKHFRSRRPQRCSCWRSEPPPAFILRRFQKTRRQFRAGTRISLSSRKMEYNSSNQPKDLATHRPRSQSQPNHCRVRPELWLYVAMSIACALAVLACRPFEKKRTHRQNTRCLLIERQRRWHTVAFAFGRLGGLDELDCVTVGIGYHRDRDTQGGTL